MLASVLGSSGGLPSIRLVPGWLTTASNWEGQHGLLASIREHVIYTVIAVALAALFAIPLGLVLGHTGRGASRSRAWRMPFGPYRHLAS